jgi:hypothetical protein
VRIPRMRQTSLATIHFRPPWTNTWTGEGLLPLDLKETVMVGWIVVAAMMLLTSRQNATAIMIRARRVGPVDGYRCSPPGCPASALSKRIDLTRFHIGNGIRYLQPMSQTMVSLFWPLPRVAQVTDLAARKAAPS